MTQRLTRAWGSRAVRGFTLIEILVVSLVIALLSSIAVINIQQFVDNNKRKTVIADLRSLGTALGFAHDDIGFYPKIGFLGSSRRDPLLAVIDTSSADPDSVARFHNRFQAYSIPFDQFGAVTRWKGPYMAVSRSRENSAQGQGGTVVVQIPPDAAFPDNGQVMRWPADVWDRPYVAYLMRWELNASGSYERRFLGRALDGTPLPNEFRERADAFVAVVSYGQNRVPGLGQFPLGPDEEARANARLFTESTLTGVDPQPRFRMFGYLEFLDIHRQVLNDPPAAIGNGPGILDPGSDDLVYEF